jgi:hypothetical protein
VGRILAQVGRGFIVLPLRHYAWTVAAPDRYFAEVPIVTGPPPLIDRLLPRSSEHRASVPATPPTAAVASTPPRPPSRRHRTKSAAAAALGVFLLGVVVYVTINTGRIKNEVDAPKSANGIVTSVSAPITTGEDPVRLDPTAGGNVSKPADPARAVVGQCTYRFPQHGRALPRRR